MCAIWGEVDTFPCILSGHASHWQVKKEKKKKKKKHNNNPKYTLYTEIK